MLTVQAYPPPCRLARALRIVGELLDAHDCYYSDGRFHFPQGDRWSIAISPESAGRFRIEACETAQPRATLWALDGEDDHLAGVVLELSVLVQRDEILERDCLI